MPTHTRRPSSCAGPPLGNSSRRCLYARCDLSLLLISISPFPEYLATLISGAHASETCSQCFILSIVSWSVWGIVYVFASYLYECKHILCPCLVHLAIEEGMDVETFRRFFFVSSHLSVFYDATPIWLFISIKSV